MAYYKKRKGYYELRAYDGKDLNGKPIMRYRTFRPPEGLTQNQLNVLLDEQLEEFERDLKKENRINGYCTFEETAKFWMETNGLNRLAPKTYERYGELLLRIFNSPIGKTKIMDLEPQSLNWFYRELAKPGANRKTGEGLSAKTIREHHNVISRILEAAWKWGAIKENVARRADPPSVRHKEIDCMNEDEVADVLRLLEDEPIQYRTMITLLIIYGCRKGELCGLEWKDIDFKKHVVHIRRSSQYVNKQIITKEPKTEKSKREVTMDGYSAALMQEYKQWQDEKRIEAGSLWTETDRLFTKADGTPIHPDTVGDWWDKFQKKHGLTHHSLHSLRHTSASILIANDTDVATVSGRLGHANATTTLKIYTHQFKTRDASAAAMMGNFVESALGIQPPEPIQPVFTVIKGGLEAKYG